MRISVTYQIRARAAVSLVVLASLAPLAAGGIVGMATISAYKSSVEHLERLRFQLEDFSTAEVSRSQALDYAVTLAVVAVRQRLRSGQVPHRITHLRRILAGLDAAAAKINETTRPDGE